MKFLISFLAIGIFSFNVSFSQNRAEKIESMKIAFITKQLDLSPAEAQVFWPVYNEYTTKTEALRKTHRMELMEAKQNFDIMKDKEVETLVDGEIAFRQKELEIQKEYHSKFKAVLPIKKVARLYQAEEMFKRELLKKMQEQRKNNGHRSR
jgi:hypothetical protein